MFKKLEDVDTTTLTDTFAPDGQEVSFGTIFKNPGLAKFFEIIAAEVRSML